MDFEIMEIASKFNFRDRSSDDKQGMLLELYKKFVKKREEPLLDSIGATVALEGIIHSGHFTPADLTPQMEEAFHLQYPNVDLNSLVGESSDVWGDYMNGWKGKYFEVLVRDRLNNGDWVGDIHLDPGQYSELAASSTQPGWDMLIHNSDGGIAEELQLKATNSLSYVHSALEKYPDIDILTTDDVFDGSGHVSDHIFSSGMSAEDLEHSIKSPMLALSDHATDAAQDSFLHDVLPFLPFVIISATEGHKVLMGKKTAQMAFASGLDRATKTGAAMTVGYVVHLLDGGMLSIPAAFLTRMGIDRYKCISRILSNIDDRISDVRTLATSGITGAKQNYSLTGQACHEA